MILSYQGKTPQIAASAFIAPTAVVIGDVVIGEGASIWFNSVIRGDNGRITIGAGSNVQDNATIHVPKQGATTLEDDVTIGHGAVLEGCVIRRGALIGMNAVVLQQATVGEGSLVAAGSVVPEGMNIPAHTLVAGVPARVKKELDAGSQQRVNQTPDTYRKLARTYLDETAT